ncbi:MAG: alpha-N-arabinofuranosidase, partial [Segatella copri]
MKKTKYLLFSAVLLASMQSVAQNPINDNPAYSIVGKDSTCQVFIYSPAENQGLHLAYFTDDERWVDVGQLCASDFGPWGSEKKMYRPFVMKANDGTWRALWSVNSRSPQFAVAYSEDLVTWRPQDYPIMKEKGITDVAAYQMDDGTFDIYLKTAKGKRYVHADRNFRTFEEDSLEGVLYNEDGTE